MITGSGISPSIRPGRPRPLARRFEVLDFDKSWREAIGLASSLREKVREIEDEQSDLDVKRDLARWLARFEALAAELDHLREEANRGGG